MIRVRPSLRLHGYICLRLFDTEHFMSAIVARRLAARIVKVADAVAKKAKRKK